MNPLQKIVARIKKNPEIVYAAAASVGAIVGYTLGCRINGFRMVRPHGYDDNFFYVQTVTGAILKAPKSE